MNKAIFFDRDGIINKERFDYVKNVKELELFPEFPPLVKSLKKHGFLDAIIERDVLNEKIGNLCSILLKKEELKTSNEETIENRESNIKVSSTS